MRKRGKFVLVTCLSLLPAIALADKDIGELKAPDPKAAFSSWTPAQQWMPSFRSDPRGDHGYGTLAGSLALADELGPRFSELGRASLIEKCFARAKEDTESSMAWALCGNDVKTLDLKKLEAELAAEGITAAPVLEDVKVALTKAQKIGAVVEAAAKDDPGLATLLKTGDAARAEWTAYLGKHKADFDRYLELRDGVRSGKSNNKAFKGCYEATMPAFARLVKATKFPWDVPGDIIPGYVSYMEATTEGYIATVSYAACAWSLSEAGESIYAGAANVEGGVARPGWRSIALAKILDPAFKPKFADRSMSIGKMNFDWKYGIKMAGINDIKKMMTPQQGVIASIKVDGDVAKVSFKGDTVEACLQWKETNKVAQVVGGSVSYEKKCVKRGQVENQVGATDVPSKFLTGAKVGDEIIIVNGFPVVAWKGKAVTALFGIAMK
jgi:hypothetical protein